jgi:hypothetical protein
MRYQSLPGRTMPDILIRGLTAGEVKSLDRLAALEGQSRNTVMREMIRRSLRPSTPIDLEDTRKLLALLSDGLNDEIMSQAWR